MSVALLALGGTISMVDRDGGIAVPHLHAEQLAEFVGGIGHAVDIALVGGSEVNTSHLHQLGVTIGAAISEGALGIVVTCGTDAIEELAAFLTWSGPWQVPIAVTGSMLPGGRPASDARANLSDAVATVRGLAGAIDPVVVMQGEVLLGREVCKTSGLYRSAFAAPGRGPIGHVGPDGPRFHRQVLPAAGRLGLPPTPLVLPPLVLAGLGDDGALLRYAGGVSSCVVVAANGAGNVPPGMRAAIATLTERDVAVLLTTRATDAAVAPVYGYPGGGAQLVEAGAHLLPGLSPHRARIIAGLAGAHGREGALLIEAVRLAASSYRLAAVEAPADTANTSTSQCGL